MQTLTGQRPGNNVSTQSRTIAIFAIFLFAFAGLISGFAVGAFVHSNQTPQTTNINNVITPPSQGKNRTPTPTTTSSLPELLGEPVIDQVQYTEIANGTTSYTVSAYAMDKHSQPLHREGITCKLWLTQDEHVNNNMPTSRLRAINTLAQPFPGETANALTFAATTSQTQPCTVGQGNWNYQLSSSLSNGTYYLVVLMDWSGVHYNWKWAQIIVKN